MRQTYWNADSADNRRKKSKKLFALSLSICYNHSMLDKNPGRNNLDIMKRTVKANGSGLALSRSTPPVRENDRTGERKKSIPGVLKNHCPGRDYC